MADKWASYRDDSRSNWGSDRDGRTIEQLNCGSLMRIADATEKMAQRHTELIRDRDFYERHYRETLAECQRLARSNAALRGGMKRIKQQAGENAAVVQKLTAEANSAPFTTIGHFVEHVAPTVRTAAAKRLKGSK